MFALLKHQFLGNSRWYAKRSLSSVLRLGHQHTLLTVTHTADANTVADYPTFARLLPNRKSRSLAPRLPPGSELWPRAGRKQVIQKSSSTLYRTWAFFPAIRRRYASRLALPKSNATCHTPPPPAPMAVWFCVNILSASSYRSFRSHNPSCFFQFIVLSAGFVSLRWKFNRAAELCGGEQWIRNNPKHSYVSPHKIRRI